MTNVFSEMCNAWSLSNFIVPCEAKMQRCILRFNSLAENAVLQHHNKKKKKHSKRTKVARNRDFPHRNKMKSFVQDNKLIVNTDF